MGGGTVTLRTLWALCVSLPLSQQRLSCHLLTFPCLALPSLPIPSRPFPSLPSPLTACCARVHAACAELTVQDLQNKTHDVHLSTQLPQSPDKLPALPPFPFPFSLFHLPCWQGPACRGWEESRALGWPTSSASAIATGDEVSSRSTALSETKAAFSSTGLRTNRCRLKAAGEHSRLREPYARGWGRRACATALAIPLRPGNCRTRAVPPVSATRAFAPGLVAAEPSRGSEPGSGLCLRAAAEAGASSRRTKPDGRGAGLANEGREGGGGVPCLNSGAGSPDLLRPAAPTGIAATGAGLVALPACCQAVTDGDC